MIPEGTYRVRGVDAALGYSSTNNEQVAVTLEFLDGGEDVEGRQMTWYGSFSEKVVTRTFESLRLLGWQGDDVSDLSGIGSTEAFAVVGYEDDREGNTRARVKWINGSGGVALKNRMDEDAARAFAERMKGHVLAHRAKGGAAAARPNGTAATSARRSGAPPRAAATPAPDDDDIPF